MTIEEIIAKAKYDYAKISPYPFTDMSEADLNDRIMESINLLEPEERTDRKIRCRVFFVLNLYDKSIERGITK